MAVFVHLTNEKNAGAILKDGIKPGVIHYDEVKKGIFSMPVIQDFYASHQWLREMKQYNPGGAIVAVYFTIPDDEKVFCGKYNEKLVELSAAEVHGRFRGLEDKLGFQAVSVNKVSAGQIRKIKHLPQTIGWRHFPESHARKRCLCPACLTRGSYNSVNAKKRKLREYFRELIHTTDEDTINGYLTDISDLDIKGPSGGREEAYLVSLAGSKNEKIAGSALHCLAVLYGGRHREKFLDVLYHGSIPLKESAYLALGRVYGASVDKLIDMTQCDGEALRVIDEWSRYI